MMATILHKFSSSEPEIAMCYVCQIDQLQMGPELCLKVMISTEYLQVIIS